MIIGVILLNILVSFYPLVKLDLSRGKVHSLSETTTNYIRNLDDVVNIKVFLTEDLPAEAQPTADSLKTILEEFGRLNRSKLRVSYFDPNSDKQAEAEAERLGIQPIQFSSLKSDKFEVQQGYFGLAIMYGDKQQTLPVAGDVGNLEYFLLSGIRKLVSDNIGVIAIAEGVEEEETEVNYLRQYLIADYKLIAADLDSKDGLPDEADILVITGREGDIGEEMSKEIEGWIGEGKGLIVFMDTVKVDNSMQGKVGPETRVEKILSNYGISVERKLLLDESSAIANFQTQSGAFLTQYPYWVQIRPENMNRDIPALSGISSITLPWVSPIKLSSGAVPLFGSSDQSTVDDKMTDLTPKAKENWGETGTKYDLAAINTDGVKVAVVADADFIKDNFLINNQQNLLLALNLVDYFSQDQTLLAIRSKNISNSPLAQIGESEKQLVKVVNTVLPILFLAITGVLVNLKRKKNNQKWYESENN